MAKFYAVKKGKVKGVYNTWEECQEQVSGFSGAEFKSFKSYDDARAYINGTLAPVQPISVKTPIDPAEVCIFTDGSFDKVTNTPTSGIHLELFGGVSRDFAFKLEGHSKSRQLAGELASVITALTLCSQMDKHICHIYYDFIGIEKWINGEWSNKKELSIAYANAYNKLVKDNNLFIDFTHAKAHSGIRGNDIADRLANMAKNDNRTLKASEIFEGTLDISRIPLITFV
jgi:ribonuclease HI